MNYIRQFYIDIKQMHFIIFLRIHKIVMVAYITESALDHNFDCAYRTIFVENFLSKFACLNCKPNKRTVLT